MKAKILLLPLLYLFFPVILSAQDSISTSAEQKFKIYSFGIKYGYGINFPTGDIEGDGGQKSIIGESESFSFDGTYKLYPDIWLIMAISKRESTLTTETRYTANTQKDYINIKFADITISGRYIYKNIYADLGLFFGYPYGTWIKKVSAGGSITESEITNGNQKAELGITLGAGYLLPVNDILSIQIGAALSIPFLAAYKKDDTKLWNNRFEIITGIQYKI